MKATLAVVAGFALIVLLTRSLWFQASRNRWDTADLASCRERYRAARTLADSQAVDALIPQRPDGRGGVESCGALREAYIDFFGSRNSPGTDPRR